MNTKMIAMILIVLGAVVLAYQGITFKSRGKPVDVLGVHVETTKTNFIPPVAGALALAGGLVLLVVNPKKT
jgi:hypothetical protein